MGAAHSKAPSPNVFENHSRALYINIPVDVATAREIAADPVLVPSSTRKKCWVSIVVDDLDLLSFHVGAGIYIRTPMSGWMTKVNVLVDCQVPALVAGVDAEDDGLVEV